MVRITAAIEGMRCPMCEAHIQDAIRKIGGVKRVKASSGKRQVVMICERELSADELHAVLDPTGYTLGEVRNEPYEKKGFLSGLFRTKGLGL